MNNSCQPNTPIKQGENEKVLCLVCGKVAKEVIKIEGTRKIKDLLNKFGGINVETGIACRNCSRRVENLNKKCTNFYNDCQKNAYQGRFKRLATSPSVIPATYKKVFNTSDIENIEDDDEVLINDLHLDDEDEQITALADITGKTASILNITKNVQSSSITSSPSVHDHIYMKKCGNQKTSTKSISTDPVIPATTDHGYLKAQPILKTENPTVSKIIKSTTDLNESLEKCINQDEVKVLHNAVQNRCNKEIAEKVLQIKGVKESVLHLLCKEINCAANLLKCRKLFYISKLMKKGPEDLKSFNWTEIVEEFTSKFQSFFPLMLSMILNIDDMAKKESIQKIFPRIGFLYGLMMQTRNRELSRIQRLISMLLFDSISDQKVFDRLQPLGISLSYDRSLDIIDMIGGHFNEKMISLVKENKRFRIIGDNINWTVGVHDQRLDNKVKMMHAFGSAIIVQNLDFKHLSNITPQRAYLETPVHQFIPSEDDYAQVYYDYTILMSRVIFEHIPFFRKFQSALPNEISRPCSRNLQEKSEVIPLPVLFKNEQYYQDVVSILDFYEKCLLDAHAQAGIDIAGKKILIGGDQLTRDRFSGAKALRAHHDTPKDRFDHLGPITFELFHMQMAYLKLMFKILYKSNSGTDLGTLKSIQDRLSRKNIGEDINQYYDTNKDFIISVIDCYIVECFLEFFGMDDKLGHPTKHIPPEFENEDDMKKWYFDTVLVLLKQHVLTKPDTESTKEVIEDKTWQQGVGWCPMKPLLRADNTNISKIIEIFGGPGTMSLNIHIIDGHVITIKLQSGKTINLKKQFRNQQKQDFVKNYGKNILQLGLLFKDLDDLIHMPERTRGLCLLKLTMLYFKSCNNLSKYALEILRFLVHQYCVLSERGANEEFYSLFVNTAGKLSSHIPADRRMEYLVKEVKQHVKHMASNKTESNIENRTRAISGISNIGENFDDITNVIKRSKKHSDKSTLSDENMIIEDLRSVRPFKDVPARFFDTFPNLNSSVVINLDKDHYFDWINSRKSRFALEKGN